MEERKTAVGKMQEYIEKHLYEEISLADLAQVSCYSPWHSYRIFTELLRISPSDYIRKLRLSKSAMRLRDDAVKIIDVAYDSGFGSVDGYQRAFCREFGCNPKEYALNPSPLYLFTPYKILPKKEIPRMEVNSVFLTIIEKPERKILIKRGKTATEYFAYCEEVGCDVWGLLTSIKSLSGEPVCMWLPKKYIKSGTSEYVQGVEVAMDYNGEIPDGFDIIVMPKAKFIMFQGEPFEEENYEQAIMALKAAIEKYDPLALGYVWDNDNPRIQLEPVGARGYIELMPIKNK